MQTGRGAEMIYAGCDLGTAAAKVLLLQDGSILASEILPHKKLPRQTAIDAMDAVCKRATVSVDEIASCVATGFGKKAVPYASSDSPEILCLRRAIAFINPAVRTVIDVGGQSIRVFTMNEMGKVTDSATNEKCAAGTGKFIEVMARALELPLDEMSRLSLNARQPLPITTQCGVFAESEVISHVNNGRERADIVAGISKSVAGKISSLMRRIPLGEEVLMVGGVAKNRGVRRYLEEELGITLAPCDLDPQIINALGAALVAQEKHQR